MSSYQHVIFDFDGTLFDSRIGIVNSVKYALDEMNISHPSEEVLTSFIGPPLHYSFQKHFDLSQKDTEYAVLKLREHYSDEGHLQSKPYEGLFEIVKELFKQNRKIGIATAKPTVYTKHILDNNQWTSYFHCVYGSDLKGELFPKEKTIAQVLTDFRHPDPDTCVMIGDTIYDIKGAHQQGIPSIAVDYGYGKTQDLKDARPKHFVENVEQLRELIL